MFKRSRFVETLPLVAILACIPLTALAMSLGGAAAFVVVILGGAIVGLLLA